MKIGEEGSTFILEKFLFCVIWYPAIKLLIFMLETWNFYYSDHGKLYFQFKATSGFVKFGTLP